MPPLYDEHGELTPAGDRARVSALMVAILSVLGLMPVAFLGPVSMVLCGDGCSAETGAAVLLATASPLLLLMSTVGGIYSYRAPTWPMLLFTSAPSRRRRR